MNRIKVVFVCACCLMLGTFLLAFAEEVNRTATAITVKGKAEVRVAQHKEWMPLKEGMILQQGDVIRTKKNSQVLLNVDGTGQTATVEVKENSQLLLAELRQDKNESTQATLLDLALGEILVKAQKLHSEKSRFEVKTPTSIVGVRGTTFSVSVEAEK